MKTSKIALLPGLIACLFLSWVTSEPAMNNRKTSVSFHLGSNVGGVTENTDLSQVPGIRVPEEAAVDAFSGATRAGVHAGIHLYHRLKRNELESGLDYMYNHQTFTWVDAGNRYIGVRRLNVSQWMLPVTWNVALFSKSLKGNDLYLKVGLIGQCNQVRATGTGLLPEYTIHPFSAGPTLGIAFHPLQMKRGDKLGVYCDIYRGSQVYEDFYNQPEFQMPGSSFIKFGLTYSFHP